MTIPNLTTLFRPGVAVVAATPGQQDVPANAVILGETPESWTLAIVDDDWLSVELISVIPRGIFCLAMADAPSAALLANIDLFLADATGAAREPANAGIVFPEATANETYNDLSVTLIDVQNLLNAGPLVSDYRAIRHALYDCVGYAEFLGKL